MRTIESAGGILLDEKKILLCKRSKIEKRFPGRWGCPAGRRDTLEESFEDIAIREVGEESGFEFTPKKLFGVYEMELDDRKVVTHLFLGDYSGNIHFDSEEVEDCQWYTLAEARKLELSFFYDRVIEDLHQKDLL